MKIVSLTIVCNCLITLGYSQANIQGIIRDESSNLVAGTIVRLLNTNYTTLSNKKGCFVFNGLTEGTYIICCTAPDYSEICKTVSIQPGSNTIELVQPKLFHSLETVVVTSPKKEDLLQQLPGSITSFSAQKIEDYRLWNLKDLSAVSANFYASHPGDNRNITSIRGITNTSYDQAVATYIDGVCQFSLDTYIPQLFNVERIEILKGPQGTLYGRNAMGGVINIITKKPGNNVSGLAEISIGNYSSQRYTTAIQAPIIKNKLFTGLAILYEGTNGFFLNDFNNTYYDKRNSVIGNHYIRFDPNLKWSLLLNTKYAINRNRGAFPLVLGMEESITHPFRVNQNATTKMVDNIFNTSVSIRHYGHTVLLNSQTAYQFNYRYYTNPIDADFSPLDAISLINNYGNKWNSTEAFTEELNFQSSEIKSSKVKWLAGTYLFYQHTPIKQATHFGEQASLMGMPDKNYSLINTSTGKNFGVALYTDITYALCKKIKLATGLRHDFEKRALRVLGEYQKDPNPVPVFAYRSDTTGSVHYAALSPRVSLTLLLSDKQTLYVSFSRGFRTGGLTPISSDPSFPALYPYKPEHGNNLEAGWKQHLFENKTVFDFSLFYTMISDVQVPSLILPDAVTIIRNTGKLTCKGAEMEMRTVLFKGLIADYNLGYTDARYNSLLLSQNGSDVDLKGKRQLFTPDITSMLSVQYSQSIAGNTSLTARIEWKYIGTRYFDLTNTIKQSPNHLLELNLRINFKKVEWKWWASNLTNARYISYAYDFGAIHVGDPPRYGMSLGLKF